MKMENSAASVTTHKEEAVKVSFKISLKLALVGALVANGCKFLLVF